MNSVGYVTTTFTRRKAIDILSNRYAKKYLSSLTTDELYELGKEIDYWK